MNRLLLGVVLVCVLPTLAPAQMYYAGYSGESWLSGNAWYTQGATTATATGFPG